MRNLINKIRMLPFDLVVLLIKIAVIAIKEFRN